jgi:uncharacterized SAM-binding protein YcdF (DUF218 family)
MFLFLSKLLPIFIYPLGLSCILLLVALVTLWKRPQAAAACMSFSLVLLLLASNSWVATGLVRSLEWQHLPPESYPKADAIVVLGGAIRPQAPPRPWVDVAEAGDRPLHAARLYLQGKAPLIILSGGRIDWKDGGPPESMDMAKLVQAMGVPASALLEDPTSLNTYENAVNVKQILDQRGIQRILLVTSAIHMPRSLRIFQKQGIEAIAAPTDFSVVEGRFDELRSSTEAIILNLLPDAENLQATSRALKEYIGIVVYWLRGWL